MMSHNIDTRMMSFTIDIIMISHNIDILIMSFWPLQDGAIHRDPDRLQSDQQWHPQDGTVRGRPSL